MANFKSSAQRGRFSVPRQGDLGINAFSEQQNNILKFLEIERRQHKEQGNEMIANLKGVASNEQRNQEILNRLRNEIWETKTKNIDVRNKRSIEHLKGIATELGKDQEYWAKFTKTGAANIGKAISAVGNLTDVIHAERWEHQFNQDGGISGAQEQIDKFDFAFKMVEGKITTEITDNRNKGDDASQTAATNADEKRLSSSKRVAELFEAEVNKNTEFMFSEMNNELIDFVTKYNEKNPDNPISVKELYPSFANAYARRILQESGVNPNTKSAQKIVGLFTKQAGIQVKRIENRAEAAKAIKNFNENTTLFLNSSLDFSVPGNKEILGQNFINLVNSGRGLWHEDKNGNVHRVYMSEPEGMLNTIKGLIGSENGISWDQYNAIKETVLPATKAGHPQQTVEQRLAYTGQIAELNTLQAQKIVSLKKISDSEAIEADGEEHKALKEKYLDSKDRHQYFTEGTNGKVLTKEAAKELSQAYHMAKASGKTQTADLLSQLLNINTSSSVSIINQNNLKRYALTGDHQGFNSIYHNLTKAEQERFQYLQSSFEGITQTVRSDTKTALNVQLVAASGGHGPLDKSSLTVAPALVVAQTQVESSFLSKVEERDNAKKNDKKSAWEGKTNLELWNLSVTEVKDNIKEGIGVFQRDSAIGTTGGKTIKGTHYSHFLGKSDTTSDFTSSELKTKLESFSTPDDLKNWLSANTTKKDYKGEKVKRFGDDPRTPEPEGANEPYNVDGYILSPITMANMIKDIENGDTLIVPQNVKDVAAHFNIDVHKAANIFLEASGSVSRVSPDTRIVGNKRLKPPGDNSGGSTGNNNSTGDDNSTNGKSTSYCSAKNLHDAITAQTGHQPLTTKQLINLAQGKAGESGEGSNHALIEAFRNNSEEDGGPLELGVDYDFTSRSYPLGFLRDKDDRRYEIIVPKSDRAYAIMFRKYKEFDMKIIVKNQSVVVDDGSPNGRLINFQNCTFGIKQ